jgi:hypothetical protein
MLIYIQKVKREMTRQKHSTDSGTGKDIVVSIQAFQSGGLVAHTRRLACLAAKSADEIEEVCLATAAILMGAAAIEALLSEAAYLKKPALYKKNKFRFEGVPGKFKMLTGDELTVKCPDGNKLWAQRVALSHAEPDHSRTRFVGTRINADGARWAAETTERLAVMIWGADMPRWFAETTGLSPTVPL